MHTLHVRDENAKFIDEVFGELFGENFSERQQLRLLD